MRTRVQLNQMQPNWSNINSTFSIMFSLFGLTSIQILKTKSQNNRALVSKAQISTDPVTILIPARNEEKTVADCVESALNQNVTNVWVTVADDQSTDNTQDILRALAKKHQNLRVVEVKPSSNDDWVGKSNALWQAYETNEDKTDWILFLDADAILKPNALSSALTYAKIKNLDLVSFIPNPKWSEFWSPAILPELAKLYGFLSNNPPPRPDSIEAGSAIGTFILVKRAAYQAIGGHKAVRDKIIEDIELAKAFRAGGFKTEQVLGMNCVEADWYSSLSELWEGMSKNMFFVAKRSWLNLITVLALEWFYGLAPIAFLLKNLTTKQNNLTRALNIVSVFLIFETYGAFNRELGIAGKYKFTYPLAVIVSTLIGVDSGVKVQFRKQISWKGKKIRT